MHTFLLTAPVWLLPILLLALLCRSGQFWDDGLPLLPLLPDLPSELLFPSLVLRVGQHISCHPELGMLSPLCRHLLWELLPLAVF